MSRDNNVVDYVAIGRLRKLRDALSNELGSPIEIVREAAKILEGDNRESTLRLRGIVSELDGVPPDGTASLWEPEAYHNKREEGERYIISNRQSILDSLDDMLNEVDPPKDLGKCIDEWANVVEAVRGGYDGYIEEYDNEVGTRSIIERLLKSGEASEELRERLANVDQEFTQLTYEDEKRFNKKSDWWWRRLPLNPAGSLKEDLEEGRR